jgi:hypothetical protein
VVVFFKPLTCEETIMSTNAVKFWILWCPTSNLPPRVKMFTEGEAEKAAEDMVNRTGREMVVMEAKTSFTKGKPKRTAIKKKAKAGTKKEITIKDKCKFCGSPDPRNVHTSTCPRGKGFDMLLDNIDNESICGSND